MQKRELITTALVDTGNLAVTLMSENLYNTIKVPLIKSSYSLKSPDNSKLTVLGETKEPIHFYIEDIKRSIAVKPIVVKDLSYNLNLSASTLKDNKVKLDFSASPLLLSIQGDCTSLVPSTRSLLERSTDPVFYRFQERCLKAKVKPSQGMLKIVKPEVQESVNQVNSNLVNVEVQRKEEKTRIKPQSEIMNFSDVKYKACLTNKCTIPPKSTQKVEVSCTFFTPHKDSPSFYFTPDVNRSFLYNKEVLPMEGVYQKQENKIIVVLMNLSDKEAMLPAGAKIGTFRPLQGVTSRTVSQVEIDLNNISEKELQRRRKFIEEKLDVGDKNMKPEMREKVIQLFVKYFEAVSTGGNDLGHTHHGECHIKLKEGAVPFQSHPRPLNPDHLKDLKRQVNEWTDSKVIAPSTAPWSSPLVPVRKKDCATFRWAVDYRRLNELTVEDSFPLPRVDESLQALSGSAVYTALDSAGAFHSVPMATDSQDFTTFTSPLGIWKFLRMPFGLKNSPSVYSRIIAKALAHLPGTYHIIYLDDVIIHSPDMESHLEHLEAVLEAHVLSGMKLKISKCHVAKSEVEYLGHRVNKDGISMTPNYVERVLSWPRPQTSAELRSFLGTASYYREFIPSFSELTAKMQEIKNTNPLPWDDKIQENFEKLKTAFSTAPVRAFPDFSPEAGRFILETDWSAEAKAAVLRQEHPDGVARFIGACAHKCSTPEQNYSSNKGEMSALIMGLRRWEHILAYRPFLVRTDNSALQWLNSLKQNRGIYSRWLDTVSLFQFAVEHKPGKQNHFADALSRRRDHPEGPIDEEEDNILDVYQIDLQDEILQDPVMPNYEDSPVTREKFKQLSQEDVVLKVVFQRVLNNQPYTKEEKKQLSHEEREYANRWEQLRIVDGLLCLKDPRPLGPIYRLCLPPVLIPKVVIHGHYNPYFGHLGQSRTTEKIAKRFFFPRLASIISSYVRNCPDCLQKNRSAPSANHIPYIRRLSRFGELVYIDLVGPLHPQEKDGRVYKYILSIEDGYTRFYSATPLYNIDSKTVAKCLVDQWCSTFGIPESLYSDNGQQFTSKVWKELMTILHIQHVRSPNYSPQSNRSERTHRLLGSLLRSDNTLQQNNWMDKVAPAVLAINSSTNRVTGVSPYFATFGREANLPLDIIMDVPGEVEQPNLNEPQLFALHIRQKFRDIYQYMMLNQDKHIHKEISNAALSATHERIEQGDMVYYFCPRAVPGISAKLQRHWLGPYFVTRVYSPSLLFLRPTNPDLGRDYEIATITNRVVKVDPKYIIHQAQTGNYVKFQELRDEFSQEDETLDKSTDLFQAKPPALAIPPIEATQALLASVNQNISVAQGQPQAEIVDLHPPTRGRPRINVPAQVETMEYNTVSPIRDLEESMSIHSEQPEEAEMPEARGQPLDAPLVAIPGTAGPYFPPPNWEYVPNSSNSTKSESPEDRRSNTPMDQEHLRTSIKRTSSHMSPGGPARQVKVRTSSPKRGQSLVSRIDQPPVLIEDTNDDPIPGSSQQPLLEIASSPRRALTNQTLPPLEHSAEFPVVLREEHPVERQQGIVPLPRGRGRGNRGQRTRGPITSSTDSPTRRRRLFPNLNIFPVAHRRAGDEENVDDTL